MNTLYRKVVFFTTCLLFLFSLSACEPAVPLISLEQIKANGTLVVLSRNAPTVYVYDRDGNPSGIEYELISKFADDHQLKIEFKLLDTVDDILAALAKGQGHIAAAGLTATEQRQGEFLTSRAYQSVSQQLVCRRGGAAPTSISELADINLHVISNSSYVNQLQRLKTKHPGLNWQLQNTYDTEYLLDQVWNKKIDCTVADSNIVAINRRYHPELTTPLSLSEENPLVWVLPSNATPLLGSVNNWLENQQNSGLLDTLQERYYGFIDTYDYVDTRKYLQRIKQRLPKYQETFKKSAEHHNLPWTLLASQAYQESHWNPKAKSPTGVRGIMMLTLPTAKEVGVSNRLDAIQSIEGGAKYLAKLHKRLPESIVEPDRTWFALAAYNVGMGHIHDARTLAERLGKNANYWSDLKDVLPLLAQKKHYKTLRYGYARGAEPVAYVNRIRNFEDILRQQLPTEFKSTADTGQTINM